MTLSTEPIPSIQCQVSIDQGDRPLAALSSESGLNEPTLEDAAHKGAVWVSRRQSRAERMTTSRPVRLRSLQHPAAVNCLVMLNYNPQVLAEKPLNLVCISDHVNYGIWCKPAGMLCQGSKWGDHTTATQVANTMTGKNCYLVHRLDKAASGLLLIAYTKNATRRLTDMFQRRAIKKYYLVTVNGLYDLPLPRVVETPLDGKYAHTEILSAEADQDAGCSELSLSIATGRKHQIRRHLAAEGFPVIGDRLYSPQFDHTQDLQLRACALSFDCPFTGAAINESLI